MSLRRTASGLATMHIFYRADKVVFCEGGKAVSSLAALLAGEGVDTSLDILFWTKIKEMLGAKKSYHFKSVGSKSLLSSIAYDVVEGNFSTIVVCRDLDFDAFLDRRQSHSCLLYTHGYSWENDVCRPEVAGRVLSSYLPSDAATEASVKLLVEKITAVSRRLVRLCEIDLALVSRSKGSLFSRKSPLALFDNFRSDPIVNATRYKKRLADLGYRRNPPRKMYVSGNDGLTVSCGKTVSALVYHLTIEIAKARDANVVVGLDAFLRHAINEMIAAIVTGESKVLLEHYSQYSSAFD